MPVFIDTLAPRGGSDYERFGEIYGSYPVLRIHDHRSRDLAERIDGNPLLGRIPVESIVKLLEDGHRAFDRARD